MSVKVDSFAGKVKMEGFEDVLLTLEDDSLGREVVWVGEKVAPVTREVVWLGDKVVPVTVEVVLVTEKVKALTVKVVSLGAEDVLVVREVVPVAVEVKMVGNEIKCSKRYLCDRNHGAHEGQREKI